MPGPSRTHIIHWGPVDDASHILLFTSGFFFRNIITCDREFVRKCIKIHPKFVNCKTISSFRLFPRVTSPRHASDDHREPSGLNCKNNAQQKQHTAIIALIFITNLMCRSFHGTVVRSCFQSMWCANMKEYLHCSLMM